MLVHIFLDQRVFYALLERIRVHLPLLVLLALLAQVVSHQLDQQLVVHQSQIVPFVHQVMQELLLERAQVVLLVVQSALLESIL